MITQKIAEILVKQPKAVILVFTVITVIIGSQIQNVYMVSELTGYLPKDDPSLKLWNEINEEFGVGSTIIIYVEADDIRDPYVLTEIDRISTKVNKYKLDNGESDGIISVRSIASLIKEENAKPYIPGGLGGSGNNEIPQDRTLIARYIARSSVQSMKGVLYVNTYKVAVIIFQLSRGADYQEILEKTQAAIDREARYSDMIITGLNAMQKAVQRKSMQSMLIIFPVAIIFISIVIFFFQRSIKGILIVFLPLVYALLLTFGLFGFFMPELTMLSIAIVALLVGLGVDYSIHILNRFTEEQSIQDKVLIVEKTLRLTGKAVLLSTITTIIGFGSLTVSTMPPIVSFGIGCIMGILFCFLSATILVPCLALILNYEKNGHVNNWKLVARIAIDNKKRVAVLACFFVVMSLVILPGIRTETNYFEMIPTGLPEVEKYLEYAKNFGGGTNLNMLLIETERQGLTYPDVIEAIYMMQEEIRKTGAKATSIADTLKEINDVLDRNILIEHLAELVDADEIIFNAIAEEGLVDEDYSKTVIIVTFPVGISSDELERLVNEVNRIAQHSTIPHNGKISPLAGQDAINIEINNRLRDEQTRSLVIALLLVLAVLILIFSSSMWGFLTIIPVLFVLGWEPGLLVMLDIPLSVITISIASIMIGIGIDYGVHITQRVREEIQAGRSKIDATNTAIEKTGSSLVEAACTTIAGLLSVFFVDIPALHQFAVVIIVMVFTSLIASIFILPVFYCSRFIK
jgi:hypothetical protein